MPYNFVADGFHTKKLCSGLSSNEVRLQTQIGRSVFLSPPLKGLGATYDDHLRLIGKRVVDFLLVLIELFSLGVMVEELRATIERKSAISLQCGHIDPKFQWMPYNFAADSFHTKKLCSRLSSSEVRFFNANRPFCVFQTPFGGLRGNVRRSS